MNEKKIKIVEIISDLRKRAGAEVFLSSLVKEFLEKSNIELTVISLWDDIDPSFDYLKNNPNIRFYTCHKKRGVDFSAARILKKIIKEVNPDIIHTHRSILLTYFLAFGFKKQRWSIVHTVHNVAQKESNTITRILRKVYIKRKNIFFIGISSEITKSIKQIHPNAMVGTIFNGVELKKGHENVPIKKYDFICVARFSAQKNHKMLISAFNKVFASDNSIKLLCVGDGELLEEVKQFTLTLPCSRNVIFHGQTDNVNALLLQSKAFVLSSLYEGNPISILEAMNASLPVVAPRVGGIPDVIEDGINGFLFEVNDEKGLVVACKKILDPSLQFEIGKRNAEKVAQYDISICATEYINFFLFVMKMNQMKGNTQ